MIERTKRHVVWPESIHHYIFSMVHKTVFKYGLASVLLKIKITVIIFANSSILKCTFASFHVDIYVFTIFFVIHPRRIDWLIVCVCDGIHTWGLMNVAVCAILDNKRKKTKIR